MDNKIGFWELLTLVFIGVNHPRPTANASEVGACKSSD